MGATDPKNLTLPLTHFLLQETNDIELTVLVGYNKTNPPKLNKLSNKFKLLNILGPVKNMAQILWEHDAVVCSGGVTLHEAIAVGTPAFVVNQVEHQQIKAEFVEKSGAAINLGIGTHYDEKKLREVLNFRKPKLELMSLKAKQLIDGRGVFRIIDSMNKLIKI
jgi:spore coat polysaccharide biosynthesis predicted glycosyltransferase SpsG